MRNNLLKNFYRIIAIMTVICSLLGTVAPIYAETITPYVNSDGKLVYSFENESGMTEYGTNLTPEQYRLYGKYSGTETTEITEPDYSGNVMSFTNLKTYYSVLCCAHGAPLWDGIGGVTNRQTSASDTYDDNVMDSGTTITDTDNLYDGYTVESDTDEEPFSVDNIDQRQMQGVTVSGPFTGREEDNKGLYKTWIINNLSNTGHPTAEQQAWWHVLGQGGEANEYYVAAERFKNYIEANSDCELSDTVKSTYTAETPTGSTETFNFNGFNLTPPKWVDTKPVVGYNTEGSYYLVGPYAVDYAKADDDGLGHEFTKIKSFKIRTDTTGDYVDLGQEDWTIVDENGNEFASGTYPDPKQSFYIKMYNKGKFENVKKINDLKVEFSYLNAQSYYYLLNCEYNTYTWEWDSDEIEHDDGTTTYRYTLRRVDGGSGGSVQTLTSMAFGKYWYEDYELTRNAEIKSARINITKKIVDGDNHEIPPEHAIRDKFSFNLKVTGARSEDKANPDKETLDIIVNNGAASTAPSRTYYWLIEDLNGQTTPDPTFELSEVELNGNYRLKRAFIDGSEVPINGGKITGTLAGGTVNVEFDNEFTGMQGYLRLNKRVIYVNSDGKEEPYTLSDEEIAKIQNAVFKYKVKIESVDDTYFYYKGSYHKVYETPASEYLEVKVKVEVEKNADGSDKVDVNGKKYIKSITSDYVNFNDASNPIYWYSENAPRYTIEEMGYELDTDGDGKNEVYSDQFGYTVFGEALTNGRYIKTGLLIGTVLERDGSWNPKPQVIIPTSESTVGNMVSETFINRFDIKVLQGGLVVIKKINLSGFTPEERDLIIEEIKKLEFKFELKVEGYPKEIIIIKGTTYKIEGDWIILRGASKNKYEWIMDAPKYTLREIEVPKGTTFDHAEITEGQTITTTEMENDTLNGTLREVTGEATIDNIFINNIDVYEGLLEVEKILGDAEDAISKKYLDKRDFHFYLDLKGNFIYLGDDGYEQCVPEKNADGTFGDRTKVRVTNDGKIIFLQEDGTPEGGDSNEKHIIITPEVNFDDAGNYDKNNIYKPGTNTFNHQIKVRWFGASVPTYSLEEDLTKTDLGEIKNPDGTIAVEAFPAEAKLGIPEYINAKGDIVGAKVNATPPAIPTPIKIVVNNTAVETMQLHAKIKVIKTFTGLPSNIDDLEKNYGIKLEDLVVKYSLDIIKTPKSPSGAAEKSHYDIELHPQKKGEGYAWESEIYNVSWDPDRYEIPTYVLEEVELPEHTKFNSAHVTLNGKADTSFVITDKKIEGKITGGMTDEEIEKLDEKSEILVENFYDNRLDIDYNSGKLEIVKIISGNKLDELKGKTFKFKVKIDTHSKFTYASKEYDAGTYYLDSKGGISTSDKARVEITIPENGNVTQVSWDECDLFKWTFEAGLTDAQKLGLIPDYEVEETESNGADNVSWSNPKGKIGLNGGTVTATCTNVKNGPLIIYRDVEIKKTFEGTLTDEIKNELKGYVFTVKAVVDGGETYTVPLVLDESSWTWSGKIEKIPVELNDDGTPKSKKVTFTEVNVPDGMHVVDITPNPADLADGDINSSLVVNVKQGFDDMMAGNLDILKTVKHDDLKNKEFEFNVKIEGNFRYNGALYTYAKPLETTVKVRPGDTKVEFKDIRWDKDEKAPTYTISEKPWDSSFGEPKYTCEIEGEKNDKGEVVGTLKGKLIKLNEEAPAEATVKINAVNDKDGEDYHGYFKFIKRVISEEAPEYKIKTTDKFTFEVTVNYKDRHGVEKSEVIATPTLGQDEEWVSPRIEWDEYDEWPTFDIFEINMPEGYTTTQAIMNKRVVKADSPEDVPLTEEFEFKNSTKPLRSRFTITKTIIGEKKLLDPASMPKFEFSYEIKSDKGFFIGNDTTIKYKYSGTVTLKSESFDKYEEFIFPEDIIWFGTEKDAPYVEVKEINLPKGWKLEDADVKGAFLSTKKNANINFANKLPVISEELLTIDMGGIVWEDDDVLEYKNHPDAANGMIGSEDKYRIKNAKVYVYENETGALAKLTDSTGKEITQPLFTDDDGKWEVNGISLPKVINKKYIVKFKYDGQTYQPTKFLSTGSNDAASNESKSNDYMSIKNKSKYHNSSLAVDEDRENFDKRISEIYGYSAIDGSGKTVGEVNGTTGTRRIDYKSSITDLEMVDKNDVSSLKSRLQTSDTGVRKYGHTVDLGDTYDLFEATASTYCSGEGALLKFPTDNSVLLISETKTIDESGLKIFTHYSQTKDYLKHINLGLARRPDAGTMAVKELVDANVVVRDNMIHYKFNKLADIVPSENGVLKRKIKIDSNYDGTYGIGLYKSDYYYREEVYESSADFKAIAAKVEDTEMEIYLNYKITLVNESSDYITKINKVYDYFDSSLEYVAGKRYKVKNYAEDHSTGNVNRTIEKLYNEGNGDGVVPDPETEIYSGSYMKHDGVEKQKDWTVIDTGIVGSDGKTYDKMEIDLSSDNVELEPNTLSSGSDVINDHMKVEFLVTMKAKRKLQQQPKDGAIQNVVEAIALGNKSNIVEVANYTTKYANGANKGKIAGKIDADSAADNINIGTYNERYWYEDDTYAAPILKIEVEENGNKVVAGKAWEDDSTTTGSEIGKYNQTDEAVIGGLTTELVEKINITDKNTGKTQTYDFVWPTNKALGSLNGYTIKEVTGFDSVIETSRVKDGEEIAGSYKFVGIPSGNYISRYMYGIDKSELSDTTNVTGDPVALTEEGFLFKKGLVGTDDVLGSASTLTANYHSESRNSTPAVYNGQDYKTTVYRYDGKEDGVDNNDAMDDEARRLEVMARSTTITNDVSETFAEANKSYGYHQRLFDEYGMFADTTTLQFKPVIEKDNGGAIKLEKYDVDVGLVERPRNDIILDKEVQGIKITTNDNKTIFDAEYDIEYDIVTAPVGASAIEEGDSKVLSRIKKDGKDKVLIARISLNKNRSRSYELMQALDKKENKVTDYTNPYGIPDTKNFRFINVDEDILQGSTITLNYKFTALNIGEEDYTTEEIAKLMNTGFADANKEISQSQYLFNKAKEVHTAMYNPDSGYVIGKTIGDFYYDGIKNGKNGDLKKATTRIRQVVDYTDNDAVFDTKNNNTENASWKNTSVVELAGDGMTKNQLLSKNITSNNILYDKDERTYISSDKNGVALSIDEMNPTPGVSLNNGGFEKELLPIDLGLINNDEEVDISKIDTNGDGTIDDSDNIYSSELYLTVTRTVSSQDDANDLSFDNIAEVVKSMNAVGRRDIKVVSGNANPKYGEFEEAIEERDSSATELVTFTPPTGIDANDKLMDQVLIATTFGLIIVAGGVMIIKKKLS